MVKVKDNVWLKVIKSVLVPDQVQVRLKRVVMMRTKRVVAVVIAWRGKFWGRANTGERVGVN